MAQQDRGRAPRRVARADDPPRSPYDNAHGDADVGALPPRLRAHSPSRAAPQDDVPAAGTGLDPRVREFIDFLVDAALDRVRAARLRESNDPTTDGNATPIPIEESSK